MQRLYSPQEVQAASRSPWWWSMASNPPCVTWCLSDHDPNEFRVEGSLTCEVDFGHGVRVFAFAAADEQVPFSTVRDEAAHVTMTPTSFQEDMAPDVALRVARALREAARFAGGVAAL